MKDMIDRQAAIKAAMQDVSDKRSHDFNAGATRAANRIKLLPTVDAIPVEWINKYTNEHRTYMHAFSEMVACWYDEKEKREYEMASDMRDYCEKYEPTYNPEDGSL